MKLWEGNTHETMLGLGGLCLKGLLGCSVELAGQLVVMVSACGYALGDMCSSE